MACERHTHNRTSQGHTRHRSYGTHHSAAFLGAGCSPTCGICRVSMPRSMVCARGPSQTVGQREFDPRSFRCGATLPRSMATSYFCQIPKIEGNFKKGRKLKKNSFLVRRVKAGSISPGPKLTRGPWTSPSHFTVGLEETPICDLDASGKSE